MKKWTTTLLSLLAAAVLLNIWAQQQPKPKNKYIPACESDEERCAKCKIYQLENKLLAGEITQEQYESDRNKEIQWVNKNCKGKPDGNTDVPQVSPIDEITEPDPTGADGSSPGGSSRHSNPICWGQRNIYLETGTQSRYTGNVKFKVCRNEATADGKCKPVDKECIYILEGQLYADLGDSLRNQPFEVTFLSKENIAPDTYLPFPLPNNLMEDWCRASPKAEKPSHEFRFLLPSGKSDSMWLIYPGQNIFLPEVKATWFDYYDQKKSNYFVLNVLDDVAAVVSNAPYTKIFNLSKKEPEELMLVLRGEHKTVPFLVVTGYADGRYLGTYEPVRLDAGVEATREALRGLNLGKLDPRIEQMVLDWKNGKDKGTITAILPTDRTRATSPISAIGNPRNSTCVTDALIKEISSFDSKDLLLESDGDYFVWDFKNIKREITWFDDLKFSPNCYLKLLAIADPDLQVVASAKGPDDIHKLVFFYHRNPNVLYSWVWKGNEAPKQFELLNGGNQRFALTGQSVTPYVQALQSEVSDAERQFFLDHADKPGSFTLLDAFFENSTSERVLLHSEEPPRIAKEKGNVMSAAVKRLSERNLAGSVLHFLITDAQNEALDWNAFRKRYHEKGWMRAVFQRTLLMEPFPELECWFSLERMGTFKRLATGQRKVAVYLPEPHRAVFGPAEVSCIIGMIDDDRIIFKPGGVPPLHLLFKNWLAPTWDTDTWRANPLGYLDRCNPPL